MTRGISCRDFVKTGAAVGATLAAMKKAAVQARGPTVLASGTTKPVVIASANGNKFKNGGPRDRGPQAVGRRAKGGGRPGPPPRGREHAAPWPGESDAGPV